MTNTEDSKKQKKTWSFFTFEYKGRHEYGKEYIKKSFEINHKDKDIATVQMVWISMRIGKVNLVTTAKKYKVQGSKDGAGMMSIKELLNQS